MLRTEPMQKVRLVCLGKDKDRVVTALHRFGMLDIRKSKLDLGNDAAPEYVGELSELIVRVGGALNLLEKKEVKPEKHMPMEQLIAEAKELGAIDEIYNANEKIREIGEGERLLSYAERIALSFMESGIDFSKLNTKHISIRGFEVDLDESEKLKADLKNAAHKAKISFYGTKGNGVALIASGPEENIDEFARNHKLKEFDFRSAYVEGTPEKMLKNVRSMKEENRKEAEKLRERLSALSEKYYSKLSNMKEMLQIEEERGSIREMFKKTEMLFVVEGWVPKKRMHELRHSIRKEIGERHYIEDMGSGDELAPTLISRPKLLRPFDYMVEFFSLPRSDEIDPTWIFIISFPIFYGLMISDVGYGIISFLFTIWIKRRTNPEGLVHNAASIWQISSIAAIVFGFITNQYLGLGINQYFTSLSILDWTTNITTILYITVIFGIVQVIAGLAFGFVNKYRKRHMKAAASKITSIVLILSSFIAIGGGLFHAFGPVLTEACGIAAIISFVATLALSGSEAGEVPNLLTHILSYTRVMGFGLSSVMIAFLIDKAFTPTLNGGPLVFIALLIPFMILHFLNMIVSIFEGIVQGIRLNFVEFFTKFYEGGGVKFRPFSYKRVYTKE